MQAPIEPLIEIVLEFVLKQIGRQGLPQVQKAWRRVTVSAIRTADAADQS